MLLIIVVRSCGEDFLEGLNPSLTLPTLVSLTLKSLFSRLISVRVRSVLRKESIGLMRVSRPSARPIVLRRESSGLSVALPMVLREESIGSRVAGFGSRTPAIFSVDRLVMFSEPIDRPIRDGSFAFGERRLFVADCSFVFETNGSLLPISVPIFRLYLVRSEERLLFILGVIGVLLELTAGCFAPMGAEELRVPMLVPIRERGFVVGCLFAFETNGFLRLLEPSIREATLERAAGCSAPLGTDGLVVKIELPIREVMLGLTLLLELLLNERFVITLLELLKFKLLLLELLRFNLLLLELLILDVLLLDVRFVTNRLELLLLDAVLVLIVLPIRDVMLELMRLFELSTGRLTVLLDWLLLVVSEVEGVLLRFDELVFDLVMICRPSTLEFGAVDRELIDRLDMLLLGARLVTALLDMLLLGARLVMTLLELLLLDDRLVTALLEVFLLGVLLVTARLDMLLLELLRLGALLIVDRLDVLLDETLLDRLDDDLLDEDLAVEDDLDDDRLELLDLLLERLLAAKTGSQNNKSANKTQKTIINEPSRRDSAILIFDF